MEKSEKTTTSLVLSLSACFMLFVFAPLDLYLSNTDEFFFDIYMILPILGLMFLVAFAVSFAILLLLQKTPLYLPAAGLFFAAFICSYIQGNYMTGWLPHLKGVNLNWNDYASHRISSIILWAIVIGVVIILLKKCKTETYLKTLRYASSAILAILLISLISTGIIKNGFAKKELLSSTPTTEKLFSYSEDRNFLIFLIDKVDARAVSDLTAENPQYSETFTDFTMYTNAEAGYPYTHHSIPLILTGSWYEKQSEFTDYENNAFRDSEFLKTLEERNYEMGLYETDLDLYEENSSRFDNMASCERKISSWSDFMIWQVMMTGYRYAPFDLKRFCYVYTNPFNSLKVLPDNVELFMEDNLSFKDYLESASLEKTSGNNFRFIHIAGAHECLYDADLNPVKNGTYEDAVKSSLKLTTMYLDIYRNKVPKDFYDNSVIIIMADHGALDIKQQNPVFMVKGINEHHDLNTNDAPISYDDLQKAYLRLLDGATGDDIFDWKEGDERERRLLFQDDDDNPEEIMEEYIQTGHAGDMDTLIKVREF